MAFWKRRSGNFEPVSPRTRYNVTYLGHEELQGKVGLDNTLKPVDDLYKQYKLKKVKAPSRMRIEVVNNGIRVEPLDAGVRTTFASSPYFTAEGPFGSVFFPINKLSFGAADPFHTKVFCFVSRNDDPAHENYWDCHAVVCESSAMAKNLTLYLVKAFQRIADSKGDPITRAQKNKKTTTVHILQERGTLEHQMHGSKKGKRPPVSTIKVTLNLDGSQEAHQTTGKAQLDNNRKVADIIAKHRSMDVSDFDNKMVLGGEAESSRNGNNVSKGAGTNTSDKENDLVDDIADDEDGGDAPREIVVTVAVNPDMSSPPTSPRKSPSPQNGEINSRDLDNAVDRDNTSPQDMITTMSPPDTPGYLTKDTSLSSAISNTPTKQTSPRTQGGSISSRGSSKKKAPAPTPLRSSPDSSSLSAKTTTTACSPRKPDTVSDVSSVRGAPSPSPSSQKRSATSPTSISDKSGSGADVGVKKKAPSPPSPPKGTSSRKCDPSPKKDVLPSSMKTPTGSTPSAIKSTVQTSSKTAVESEKKLKKEKRKSVRFAVDGDDLID